MRLVPGLSAVVLLGLGVFLSATDALAGPPRTLTLRSRVKSSLTEAEETQSFRFQALRGTQLAIQLSGKVDGLTLSLRNPHGESIDLAAQPGYSSKGSRTKLKKFVAAETGEWRLDVTGAATGEYVLKLSGKIRKQWDATVTLAAEGQVELPVSIPSRSAVVKLKAKAAKKSLASPVFGQLAHLDLGTEGRVKPGLHSLFFSNVVDGDVLLPLTNTADAAGDVKVRIRVGGWKPQKTKLDLRNPGEPAVAPNPTANATTSYESQKTPHRLSYLFGPLGGDTYNGFFHAVGYADFDDDGDLDCLQSGSDTFSKTRPFFFRQHDEGDFVREDSFVQGGPGVQHPKKVLIADFDGNDTPDVVVLGHGLDRPPFPGEANSLYLNDGTRLLYDDELEQWPGFFHSGACGDIDNDGDVDLFLGVPHEPYFLLNDGTGQFTERRDLIEAELSDFFAAELIDVDRDGYLDVLLGGEEAGTGPPQILWGDSTGKFVEVTNLPTMSGYEIVLDLDADDLTGDGLTDIVLTRTGGGQTGGPSFYDGFFVQLLVATDAHTFRDETHRIDTPGNWGYRNRGLATEQLVMSEVGSPPVENSPAGWNWNTMLVQLVDVNDDQRLDIVELQDYRDGAWLNGVDGLFRAQFVLDLADDPDFSLLR